MSVQNKTQAVVGVEQDAPGIERWLLLCLVSFVPVAGIFFVPRGMPTWILIGAAAAFLAAGLAMLARIELKRARVPTKAFSDL